MEPTIPFGQMDRYAAAEAANQLNTRYFAGHTGVHFLEISPELALAEMEARPDLYQPMGLLHGGVLTTLADTACAHLAVANLREPETTHVVTTELKINFLGNLSQGKVRAEARPVQVGRRLMVLECRMFNEAGRLLALFIGSWMVVPHTV